MAKNNSLQISDISGNDLCLIKLNEKHLYEQNVMIKKQLFMSARKERLILFVFDGLKFSKMTINERKKHVIKSISNLDSEIYLKRCTACHHLFSYKYCIFFENKKRDFFENQKIKNVFNRLNLDFMCSFENTNHFSEKEKNNPIFKTRTCYFNLYNFFLNRNYENIKKYSQDDFFVCYFEKHFVVNKQEAKYMTRISYLQNYSIEKIISFLPKNTNIHSKGKFFPNFHFTSSNYFCRYNSIHSLEKYKNDDQPISCKNNRVIRKNEKGLINPQKFITKKDMLSFANKNHCIQNEHRNTHKINLKVHKNRKDITNISYSSIKNANDDLYIYIREKKHFSCIDHIFIQNFLKKTLDSIKLLLDADICSKNKEKNILCNICKYNNNLSFLNQSNSIYYTNTDVYRKYKHQIDDYYLVLGTNLDINIPQTIYFYKLCEKNHDSKTSSYYDLFFEAIERVILFFKKLKSLNEGAKIFQRQRCYSAIEMNAQNFEYKKFGLHKSLTQLKESNYLLKNHILIFSNQSDSKYGRKTNYCDEQSIMCLEIDKINNKQKENLYLNASRDKKYKNNIKTQFSKANNSKIETNRLKNIERLVYPPEIRIIPLKHFSDSHGFQNLSYSPFSTKNLHSKKIYRLEDLKKHLLEEIGKNFTNPNCISLFKSVCLFQKNDLSRAKYKLGQLICVFKDFFTRVCLFLFLIETHFLLAEIFEAKYYAQAACEFTFKKGVFNVYVFFLGYSAFIESFLGLEGFYINNEIFHDYYKSKMLEYALKINKISNKFLKKNLHGFLHEFEYFSQILKCLKFFTGKKNYFFKGYQDIDKYTHDLAQNIFYGSDKNETAQNLENKYPKRIKNAKNINNGAETSLILKNVGFLVDHKNFSERISECIIEIRRFVENHVFNKNHKQILQMKNNFTNQILKTLNDFFYKKISATKMKCTILRILVLTLMQFHIFSEFIEKSNQKLDFSNNLSDFHTNTLKNPSDRFNLRCKQNPNTEIIENFFFANMHTKNMSFLTPVAFLEFFLEQSSLKIDIDLLLQMNPKINTPTITANKLFLKAALKNYEGLNREVQLFSNIKGKQTAAEILASLPEWLQNSFFISFFVTISGNLAFHLLRENLVVEVQSIKWSTIRTQFRNIMIQNKEILKRKVVDIDQKRAWWKDRYRLDTEIKDLLGFLNKQLKNALKNQGLSFKHEVFIQTNYIKDIKQKNPSGISACDRIKFNQNPFSYDSTSSLSNSPKNSYNENRIYNENGYFESQIIPDKFNFGPSVVRNQLKEDISSFYTQKTPDLVKENSYLPANSTPSQIKMKKSPTNRKLENHQNFDSCRLEDSKYCFDRSNQNMSHLKDFLGIPIQRKKPLADFNSKNLEQSRILKNPKSFYNDGKPQFNTTHISNTPQYLNKTHPKNSTERNNPTFSNAFSIMKNDSMCLNNEKLNHGHKTKQEFNGFTLLEIKGAQESFNHSLLVENESEPKSFYSEKCLKQKIDFDSKFYNTNQKNELENNNSNFEDLSNPSQYSENENQKITSKKTNPAIFIKSQSQNPSFTDKFWPLHSNLQLYQKNTETHENIDYYNQTLYEISKKHRNSNISLFNMNPFQTQNSIISRNVDPLSKSNEKVITMELESCSSREKNGNILLAKYSLNQEDFLCSNNISEIENATISFHSEPTKENCLIDFQRFDNRTIYDLESDISRNWSQDDFCLVSNANNYKNIENKQFYEIDLLGKDYVFLITDESTSNFPFDTLEIFEEKPVYRIPNLEYLTDHIHKVLEKDFSTFSYILDPDNNLKNTYTIFSSYLNRCKEYYKNVKFFGSMRKRPDRNEWYEATNADIFAYFGHGTGEKYYREDKAISIINEEKTRDLKAVGPLVRKNTDNLIFLFGCSSSKLKCVHNFQRNGVVLKYLEKSRIFLGCMWDVTDKDLDRFTLAFLENIFENESFRKKKCLGSILNTCRKYMKLRYLNGSAVVVWGIPTKVILKNNYN